jgi:hypothetical protein
MNKITGMIQNNVVGGLVSNRPPTHGEQHPVKLPDMYDKVAIEAQRESMRQEEADRSKPKSN